MDKKKIIVIVPCLYGGGAERAALRLCTQLSNRFEVILCNMETGLDYDIPDSIRRVVLTDVDGRANPFSKILAFVLQIIALNKLIKHSDTHLLITFTQRANVLGSIAKIITRIKLIISYRNHQTEHLKQEKMFFLAKWIRNFIYRNYIRLSTRLSDHIVALSENVKEDLVKNFKLDAYHITVIYNEYDLEKIREASQEPVAQPLSNLFSYPTVIAMGRLERQKGMWHLIRAHSETVKSIENAKLIIAGTGSMQNYLEKVVVECGMTSGNIVDMESADLSKNVYFVGFQKNPFALIARANIFAFPSIWEGFGNALLEAMACGTPVISSDCNSGPREMLAPGESYHEKLVECVRKKYGYLCPKFSDSQDTSEKIRLLEKLWGRQIAYILASNDVQKKLSEDSFAGSKRFGVGSQVSKWLEVIELTK